ncbi:C-type lectin domain family 6 member A isoform X2 [Acanthochromis polyacanthus]|uniref:C-type lectin domain family 6 member A isoform X2 n=1 Tax=Acanthochromis polyacanthus TaxID=80966 RepID=UPI000B8FC2FA|nr:C-type lectin domain family 6 member A isoform X2 [Acanthochromis polyacanthus]
MYLKFFRGYFEEKKDEGGDEELSVDLQKKKKEEGEEGGKPPQGNVRLYRAGCLLLSLLCFVLLLAVIILSMKLQTESTVCLDPAQTLDAGGSNPPACNLDQCMDDFPDVWPRYLGCQQCSNGWLTLGRSCFFLSTFRLTWAESQKNCSSSGGHLAVISNRTVQTFLTKKGNLKYWIGLKNTESTWSWVDNKALQQSYWSDVPLDGDCGLLSGSDPAEKNWIRAPCRASSYFICQLQF